MIDDAEIAKLRVRALAEALDKDALELLDTLPGDSDILVYHTFEALLIWFLQKARRLAEAEAEVAVLRASEKKREDLDNRLTALERRLDQSEIELKKLNVGA